MALLRGALLCGVLLAVEHAAAFAPPAGLISGQGRGNMGARQTKDAAVPPRHFSAGRRVFMMNAAKDPVDEKWKEQSVPPAESPKGPKFSSPLDLGISSVYGEDNDNNINQQHWIVFTL